MLRSPGSSDARQGTPLPDNKRDAGIEGSTDRTPPISEREPVPESATQHIREQIASTNALQESAYRLHALVKRSSPQKISRSPIRFNRTEPLPSIGKALHSPKKATGGPATGGIGKAPPSPRRSPLRGGVARDAAAGPPQTRNVVERMIAYARHAASQEDPDMVQRDRLTFVSRLADRSAAPERASGITADSLKQSPAPSASSTSASHSAASFPIMSNLSVHANLRRQQQASKTSIFNQSRTPPNTDTNRSTPSPRVAESGPIHTRERRDSQASRDERAFPRERDSLTDVPTIELNGPSPSLATAPLPSSLAHPPVARRVFDRARERGTTQHHQHNHDQPHHAASRIITHESSVSATPSTPRRDTQRVPASGMASHAASQARAQPTLSRPYISGATPPPWDKQRWRVFIQAVHASCGPNHIAENDVADVLSELVRRLPPDMRDISVQELAHRLHAWARSSSRAAGRTARR